MVFVLLGPFPLLAVGRRHRLLHRVPRLDHLPDVLLEHLLSRPFFEWHNLDLSVLMRLIPQKLNAVYRTASSLRHRLIRLIWLERVL